MISEKSRIMDKGNPVFNSSADYENCFSDDQQALKGFSKFTFNSPFLCWTANCATARKTIRDRRSPSPRNKNMLCFPVRNRSMKGSHVKKLKSQVYELQPDELYEGGPPTAGRSNPIVRAQSLHEFHKAKLYASIRNVKDSLDFRRSSQERKQASEEDIKVGGDSFTQLENWKRCHSLLRSEGRGRFSSMHTSNATAPSMIQMSGVKTNGSLRQPKKRPLSYVGPHGTTDYQKRILELSHQLSRIQLHNKSSGMSGLGGIVAVVPPTVIRATPSTTQKKPARGHPSSCSFDSGRGSTSPDPTPVEVSSGDGPVEEQTHLSSSEAQLRTVLLPSEKYQDHNGLSKRRSKSSSSKRSGRISKDQSTSDFSSEASPCHGWGYMASEILDSVSKLQCTQCSVMDTCPASFADTNTTWVEGASQTLTSGVHYMETDLDDVFLPPTVPTKKLVRQASTRKLPTTSVSDSVNLHQPSKTHPVSPPRKPVQVLSLGEPTVQSVIPINPDYHFKPIMNESVECDSLAGEFITTKPVLHWTSGQVQCSVGTLC